MKKKFLLNLSFWSKKGILSLMILIVFSITGFSQNVGISSTGSVPANKAAGLDINFADKGLLMPRIALTGTTSFSPLASHVAGMVVYNLATNGDVAPGYYFNDGAKWNPISIKGNNAGDIQYWDGTNWVLIPIGSTGQVLQVNSSGIPTWSSINSPTLTTKSIASITTISAASGGIILNDGGTPVLAYGVCWATSTGPTIADSFTTDGAGIGSFTSNISGLSTGTIYFLRAYATTTNGTTYGNELNFTTP
jgi:hypothetical protein